MHNYAGFSEKDNEIPLLAFFAAHAPAPSEEYISMEMRRDKNNGCSCNGSCAAEHVKSAKSFVIDGVDLSQYDPEVIKFANLEAKFDSY